MLYMLMICYDPSAPPDPDERNRQPEHAAMEQEMREAGQYHGGAGLFPIEMAKRVRHEGDNALVTDGPFAETKESIGGFFIVQCEQEDEAIAYAKRIATDSHSWIEVRPIGLWHPK